MPGGHHVLVADGHLPSRPWAAGVTARELMISLWYPAAAPGGRRARYMTPAESELQLAGRGLTGVPPDALATVETSAVSDAPPAGQQRSLPLVVLSPGFTSSRSTLTALAEDLASHGYVVAGVDHTYESHATAFPDGRVTTCLSAGTPAGQRILGKGSSGPGGRCVLRARRADRRAPGLAGRRADHPSRIAMAGHSAGGAAAIAAMLADLRICAGIDMDGSTVAPIPDRGLSRPFMFLGKESDYTPGSGSAATTRRDWKLLRAAVTTWERDWELLAGWKRWLVVAGAVHASFTDLALLADGLGIDIGPPARSPVPGHHPPLRPGLLRPAPARQAASPAGRAVILTLPGGLALFPVGACNDLITASNGLLMARHRPQGTAVTRCPAPLPRTVLQ